MLEVGGVLRCTRDGSHACHTAPVSALALRLHVTLLATTAAHGAERAWRPDWRPQQSRTPSPALRSPWQGSGFAFLGAGLLARLTYMAEDEANDASLLASSEP